VSAVKFSQNVAKTCAEDVAGQCTGVFSSCASRAVSPSCDSCAEKTCVVDSTGNAHCFASTIATDSCLCASPSPNPENQSNTGLVVGLVFGAIILVLIVGGVCYYGRKTEYRTVQ